MADKKEQVFDDKQIDEWLKNGHKPEDVKSLLQQITKAVVERALQSEITEHLGYAQNDVAGSRTAIWKLTGLNRARRAEVTYRTN
jgi:transposase-like protein